MYLCPVQTVFRPKAQNGCDLDGAGHLRHPQIADTVLRPILIEKINLPADEFYEVSLPHDPGERGTKWTRRYAHKLFDRHRKVRILPVLI